MRLGSRTEPGALTWEKGDPRFIKDYLAQSGISCWLDVEQTGKVSARSRYLTVHHTVCLTSAVVHTLKRHDQ